MPFDGDRLVCGPLAVSGEVNEGRLVPFEGSPAPAFPSHV